MRHEVDEFLDPADQRRLEIVPVAYLRTDMPPRPGDVGLIGVRQAQRLARAVFPVHLPRHVRPGGQPQPLRLDGLPDVDVRVTDDEGVGATWPRRTASAMRASLEPVTRWSTST